MCAHGLFPILDFAREILVSFCLFYCVFTLNLWRNKFIINPSMRVNFDGGLAHLLSQQYYTKHISCFIQDVFVGGTDTISSSTEWVMSELLRHPRVMEKLQSEVRGIVKQNQHIKPDDLEKMGYMKAVIKETLRLHPPFPIITRITRKDVHVKGYDVASGTMVMINAWALGRDPVSWDEPEKFRPERFLNSAIDLKGQDFELIPFGAGRRGCPGITYATVTMEILLANLVHKFDWKLPNGIDLDMTESHGVTVHRASPLLALASQPK